MKRLTHNKRIRCDENSLRSCKLTKVLPDSFFPIHRKELFLNHLLSKMRGKFKMNLIPYPIDWSKLIYLENRIWEKFLQDLKLCQGVNLIISFALIQDLFNYLEDILGNFYQKKQAIEKFWDVKIKSSLLENFSFWVVWQLLWCWLYFRNIHFRISA